MSGRLAARDAIERRAVQTAQQHKPVKRATVTAGGGTAAKLHDFDHPLQESNDYSKSQWVKLYDYVVGIEVGDLALFHEEDSEWVMFDVVSDKDVCAYFEQWNEED